MKLLKQSVGIDISKDKFSVSLMTLTEDFEESILGFKEFSNDEKGFASLLNWVDKKAYSKVLPEYIMEYTGVYYERLAYYLFDQSKSVHVVMAHQVKKYAESLNVKLKTDKTDSKFIAKMGLERKLKIWEPCKEIFRVLKCLSREKEDLHKAITISKNQLHSLVNSVSAFRKTVTRVKKRISYLEKQVKMIDLDIIVVIQKDEELSAKISKIASIPGIGFNTIACIVGETNGFQLIKNVKQLTSYAGLDIRIQESGKWQGKSRISKKGNSHLRRALYMPSLSVVRHSESHKVFYERLKERKEKAKIALTAVQRKMLGLIFTLWKNDTEYIPNYENVKNGHYS